MDQNEEGEINPTSKQNANYESPQQDINKENSRQGNQTYYSKIHAQGLPPIQMEDKHDKFVSVLMVAQKPSIARSIAEALGGYGFTSRKGICKYTNVYTFYGHIFGKKALIKITSVLGHIYSSDFTEEYQDWRRVDPYKLFSATTLKKETNPKSCEYKILRIQKKLGIKKQSFLQLKIFKVLLQKQHLNLFLVIQHLQKEALGASYLILWLDNDREGENICFEVMTICKQELIKENFQQIYRAKFSSLTPLEIRKSFDQLSSGPNYHISQAVDARQIIDLKVGVAFSRFQTKYLRRKYEEMDSKKITFGPCQTPTLAFCVQRDDQIKKFVSKQIYKINPKINMDTNELSSLDWSKDRTYDQQEAIKIKEELEKIGQLTVLKVDTKETQKIKPIALNTVNFLQLASKQFGLGPQNAMQVAEKLYLSGYITYPRTESTKYADSFNFIPIIKAIRKYRQSQNITDYAQLLTQNGITKSRLGKDLGDHPPITPTNKILLQQLSREEQNIYELICRYFLASLSPDCRIIKKKVVFQCENHTFSLIGTSIIDKGYLEILPQQKIQENEIPNFQVGDQINLHSVEIFNSQTQPPEHLTESDLIGLMEQHGIGTDASMAQHVAHICEREYVQVVGEARRLVPTDLGSSLIHAYFEIDPELVEPDLRGSIEKSLYLISIGELDKDQVLTNVLGMFRNKYLYFVRKVGCIDKHFNNIYQTIESVINNSSCFTKCGRCKSNMKLLDKISKIYCERCKFMYSLPRNSKFTIPGNYCCPIDGFQLILAEQTIKGNIKRYTICPLCYLKTPELGQANKADKYLKTSCNLCPIRSCQFSMWNNEIGPCLNCQDKGGKLVLDWPSEDSYSMTCNMCCYQYIIVKNGILIRSQLKCTECTCFQVKIETKDGQTVTGCLFCNEILFDSMEKRPPQVEQVSEENNTNENIESEQNKVEQQQPQKLSELVGFNKQSMNQQYDMQIESSDLAQGLDQQIQRNQGKNKFEFSYQYATEKENAQEYINVQGQNKNNTQIVKQQEQFEEQDIKNNVDFVKKRIQKQGQKPVVGYQQQKYQHRGQNRSQGNHYQSILEDSIKQDMEFFSKFPQNSIVQENAETLSLLKDTSMLLADIERASGNTRENITQKNIKDYQDNQNQFQQTYSKYNKYRQQPNQDTLQKYQNNSTNNSVNNQNKNQTKQGVRIRYENDNNYQMDNGNNDMNTYSIPLN